MSIEYIATYKCSNCKEPCFLSVTMIDDSRHTKLEITICPYMKDSESDFIFESIIKVK